MNYTIDQFVGFAKNEQFELMFATEEQIMKVVNILNDQGLCGDDVFTHWTLLHDEMEWLT